MLVALGVSRIWGESQSPVVLALGRIDSNPQAREALREVLLPAWPTKRVRNPEEISSEAIIQSHRKSIRATNRRIWTITSDDSPFSCEYRTPIGSITAAFPSVVIWNAHTEPGDSGSPVVSRTDPKLLLGMHIAGNDSGKAMMIPAYELFNPVRFGCPPGTRFIVPRSI